MSPFLLKEKRLHGAGWGGVGVRGEAGIGETREKENLLQHSLF